MGHLWYDSGIAAPISAALPGYHSAREVRNFNSPAIAAPNKFSMYTFCLCKCCLFELNLGQEGSQEAEVQPVGLEEPEEEVECPNHELASFVKGKPRSIQRIPLLSKVYLNMLYLLMH